MPTDRELLDQLATEYADYKSRKEAEVLELTNDLKLIEKNYEELYEQTKSS